MACTKHIDLKTEVEFDVTIEHDAKGFVNEGLTTNITVVPEAVLEDFSYSYSYSVAEGEGYFKDISGKVVPQNENIALNPFSAALTYVGIKAGEHSIAITASDNYGFTEQVHIEYTVEEIKVEENPDDIDDDDEVIKSNLNEITAFAIVGQTGNSRIDANNHTISLDVPFGTALNVAPTVLTISPLAEVDASDLGQRDFNTPITYRITAENGDIQEWTIRVVVGPKPNEAPTVDAGTDTVIHILLPGDTTTATLDGIANDVDGMVTTQWSIDSGAPATITTPNALMTEVTGLTAGTYAFRLAATDDNGATSSDMVTVKINIAPTADAGDSKELSFPTNAVTVSGLAGDSDGTFTVKWTQVEIRGEAATILNPDDLTIEITDLAEGLNVFELTVTDNDNAVSKDRMFVEVKRPEPQAQP